MSLPRSHKQPPTPLYQSTLLLDSDARLLQLYIQPCGSAELGKKAINQVSILDKPLQKDLSVPLRPIFCGP